MEVFEYSTYLCCGVVCFVMMMFLLNINTGHDNGTEFIKVKRFLALDMALEVLKNLLCMILIHSGEVPWLMDYFISPMLLLFQIYIMTLASLELMHSDLRHNVKFLAYPLPALLLALVYAAGYWFHTGSLLLTGEGYRSFLETGFADKCTFFLVMYVFFAVIFSVICLVKTVRGYTKSVGDYFSGEQEESGAGIVNINYILILFWGMSVFDFFMFGSMLDAFFMWMNAGILAIFTITILNIQSIYSSMAPAFEPETGNMAETSDAVSAPVVAVSASSAIEDKGHFEDLVHAWCSRPDKPYLQEGLTITQTAEEMGVTSRFLSGFLNDIYEMNFNSWINSLRVAEVKRQIEDGTDKSMSELAMMMGFTDLSAMSRIFKRLVGETPTQYRASVRRAS